MISTFGRINGTSSREDYFGNLANGFPFIITVADVFQISDVQILEHSYVGDYSNFTGSIWTWSIEIEDHCCILENMESIVVTISNDSAIVLELVVAEKYNTIGVKLCRLE